MSFESIWESHYPAIYRLASSYEANKHRLEELIQEIAVAIWMSKDKCLQAKSVKAYLLRIAHNKAVDHVSQQVKEPVNKNEADQELEHLLAAKDASEALHQTQQQQALLNAMRRLPVQQKQTVALLFEGMSYQEIAEITGLTPSNVGVSIKRAKQSLMEIINEQF